MEEQFLGVDYLIIGSRFQVPHALCYQRSFRGQFSLRARRRRFKRRKRTIKIRCSFIAVGNGPFYGNNLAVCPGAILDDGLLSISVFRDFSKLELVWHFWSISQAGAKYHPKLEMFEGQTLEVSSSKPLSVHVDGQTHRHDAGPISCIAQGIEGCGQVTGEVALLDLTRWPERRATMIAAATRR